MTWYLLIPLVLGAPLTLLLHEFSHVVETWATGGRVDVFKPWPHRWDGRWWFGRIMRTGGGDKAVAQAPAFKAGTMILFWGSFWVWSAWPLWPLIAWEAVDLAWWLRGWILRKPDSDGGKARG